MRDDRHRWTEPGAPFQPINLGQATLCEVTGLRQTLISGTRVLKDAPALGWPEIAPGTTYRIALRRDRVVEIGGPDHAEGWNASTSQASSDITDGFRIFELSGPLAFALLTRGTEISLDLPSASVVRRAFGLDLWLYRHGNDTTFRLHVARAYGEALISTLEAAAKVMPTR